MKSLPDAVEEFCRMRDGAGLLVIEVQKVPTGFDVQQASDSGALSEVCDKESVLRAMIVGLESTLAYYNDLAGELRPQPPRVENHQDYRFAFLDGEILVHTTMAERLDVEEFAKRLEFMANKVRTEAPIQPPRERH